MDPSFQSDRNQFAIGSQKPFHGSRNGPDRPGCGSGLRGEVDSRQRGKAAVVFGTRRIERASSQDQVATSIRRNVPDH